MIGVRITAIKKMTVPKINLPIKYDGFYVREADFSDSCGVERPPLINFGLGDLVIEKTAVKLPTASKAHDCYYFMETIEDKVREMTLSEIEKKLGHKVKIVNDK